jgi:hypothetical protein
MSRIFYKATRPDGTDFHTGTVRYEVGKRVRPAKHTGKRRFCGPGLLHAADVPAETLVGGSWPCRLFEVTGKPVAGLDDRHPHKAGFRELRVAREIPAHLALGPNGVEVARFIEACGTITPEQANDLAAARDAAWVAARDAAWDAAGALVVRDLITPEQFDVLTGPWVSVMGRSWEGEQDAR